MTSLQKVQKWSKKKMLQIRDFFKYRVMVEQKQILLIGGNNQLGQIIANNLKDEWRITNIDKSLLESAHKNVDISSFTELQKVRSELQQLNIKFDAVLCLTQSHQTAKASDIECFEQLDQSFQESLVPALLAGQLANEFISDTGLFMLLGGQHAFDQLEDKSQVQDLIDAQVNMLGLWLGESEDIPLDVTISTLLLKQKYEEEEIKQIANIIYNWTIGVARPHSPSVAELKTTEDGLLYPNLV